MKTKHIIWDWNGTILNDAWLCVEIVNEMLEKRNIPLVTEKYYSDTFDFPVENYYRNVGFDLESESFEELSDEYMSAYEKRKRECKLHSFFNNSQAYISNNNIKQSILSACADDYLKDAISHHELTDSFDHISGLNNIFAHSKEDNGRKLINEISIPKEECILIGDTIHDLDVANAMGIECWLIPSGHNSLERLKKRTDKIIDKTVKLIDIIE